MKKLGLIVILLIVVFSCRVNDDQQITIPKSYKILALGDSYTIGQSVCETCRFPEQLKDSLITKISRQDTISLKVIAQTGWTTTNLKSAINNENLSNDNDIVTLLIGVNNQFQSKPFSLYEEEFPELVTTATTLANGNQNNIIVVSIPDYAYTPFGQGFGLSETTTEEINMYNAFAENYCAINNITFINITDITRNGLINTNLVASDGLHPSELAYTMFVERILPVAIEKIR
ncbi:SGNH/GDSL hydrolase family protein [Winogradskyella sp. PG-2]|uniref:SGNH/GDSL hydrolase family protein n=1 Tax=Winogradskyella sp. PG-2 TaxID=754409 RepID=UPI0004586E49|nr:SGNH/GDSL hydrolase family protein [Winogradskyella sp. PG-2]BAO75922.1 lysophospholipase L1 and related esterases [Winogradskyella sp. PG-2]